MNLIDYFNAHNYKPVFIESKNNNIQTLHQFRLYLDYEYWCEREIKNMGWLPIELRGKLGNPHYDSMIELIKLNFIQIGYIRNPGYLTMFDIFFADKKIFAMIVKKYFTMLNVTHLIKEDPEFFRSLMVMGKVYIIHDGKRIYSISHCIQNNDTKSLLFLIKNIGMKPDAQECKLIDQFNPELAKLLFLLA